MKSNTKMLVAPWHVCITNGRNPFRVVKLGTARMICIKREGELDQGAWHFTTRQKAREFALRMNEAAKDAIAEIQDGKILSSSEEENKTEVIGNEFVVDGKTYITVENGKCEDCAFCEEDCWFLKKLRKIPYCSKKSRDDRREVIFAEKGNANQ